MTDSAHTPEAAGALTLPGPQPIARERINVHSAERLASALAGGVALAWGLGRRSPAGAVAALLGGGLVYRGVSGRCAAYRALGVDTSQAQLPSLHLLAPASRTQHYDVVREVTIQKSPQEIYNAWKRPETLRQVMDHIAEIEPVREGVSRWTLRDPLGHAHTFVVEVVEDVPDERVRWASADEPSVLEHGRVDLRPAPGDRGTEVRLHLHFARPAGWIGDLLAKVLGPIPGGFAQRALRNLQSLLEAGELPSLHKNPAARPSTTL